MSNAAIVRVLERGTDWTIGKNVHILLIRSEETQASLAQVLGMSPQLLSHKLKGKRPWAANEIEGAARHFHVSIDSLFRRLPDLDSNQEPAGLQSVVQLDYWRDRRDRIRPLDFDPADSNPHTAWAFVTDIFRKHA